MHCVRNKIVTCLSENIKETVFKLKVFMYHKQQLLVEQRNNSTFQQTCADPTFVITETTQFSLTIVLKMANL